MGSTGRFGWFMVGLVVGAIVLAIYDATVGFVPGWLRSGAVLVRFIIQLVAWFGVMLAVVGVLGWRVVRRDEVNYAFVGFGAIIVTLELLAAIPFGVP